jgi:hypothetical protein
MKIFQFAAVLFLLSVSVTVLLNTEPAHAGGIPYTYTLPVEANVTLGVFDSAGHLVQTFVKDAHRRVGRFALRSCREG